jgi:hypothetical protein
MMMRGVCNMNRIVKAVSSLALFLAEFQQEHFPVGVLAGVF